MSEAAFLTSPTAFPVFHCDYSDWSPSFSIIPSIYLLAFLVGCLGNSLVLWVYLDQSERRHHLCCFHTSGHQKVGDAGRAHKTTCGDSSKQSYRLSTVSSSSSHRPSVPRSSRSLTDSLIASLALADLCFLVTLPLWAVYTAMGYHWPFGGALCQISSFLTALNMYASVFSLSMLSVERYWVLTGHRQSSHQHPHSCSTRAVWILGGMWVMAGVLALPGLLLRSVREVDVDLNNFPSADSGYVVLSCQMDYSMLVGAELEETDKERIEMLWAAALGIKSTIIGFLLPLVILVVCYCSLAQLVSKHFGQGPHPDRKRQRRLLRVIITLVMAFFFCWLPLHINKTLSMMLEFGFIPYSCSMDQTLLAVHPYATCLAYLNSCLNPLLYAACDQSFRKKCKKALFIWCRRRAAGRTKRHEEKMEMSSAFKTKTQEETANRTEEGKESSVDGDVEEVM